jgi:hypothetical protein
LGSLSFALVAVFLVTEATMDDSRLSDGMEATARCSVLDKIVRSMQPAISDTWPG